MSGRALGEAVGVSYQQVGRYESGADRMAAAMLIRICGALGTSIASICEAVGQETPAQVSAPQALGTTDRLLADFTAIREPAVRANLCKLVASMAAATSK